MEERSKIAKKDESLTLKREERSGEKRTNARMRRAGFSIARYAAPTYVSALS